MTQNSIKNKFSNLPLPTGRQAYPPLPSGPGSAPEGLMPRREALLGRRLKGGERELSFSFQVTTKDQGRRLDQFLSETNLNLSRSQAKNLIQKHHILLNQKLTKPSAHIKAGDIVSGTLPEPSPISLKPEPIPLTILYEDPSIIVIDKPSGMVVHPAYGNPSGTLVNLSLIHI